MEQEDLSSYNTSKSQGTKAILRLLERKPDSSYLSKWTDLLARKKAPVEKSGVSVIIFRLNTEWLAISSSVFCEVMSYKKIHRIPHRTNAILMGLVNYQGMLRLCVNIHKFLGLEPEKPIQSPEKLQRMVSIQKDSEQWIFAVDEVQGVFHADIHHMQRAPVTVSKSKENYLRGIIDWQGKNVGYIDEDLLFFCLRRSIL